MILKNFHYFIWSFPFVSFMMGYFFMYQLFSIDSLQTPGLVGRQLHEVITAISNKNLNIRLLATKEEPDLPTGTILSQKPTAGQPIKPNQSIYIVLSEEPPLPQAPNFIQKKQHSIKQLCKKNNIRTKNYTVANTYPADRCFAQHPEPNETIKNHTIITYISDGGKKPLLLPNFKGQPLELVLEFLENHAIKPSLTYTHRKHNQTQEYTVIDQRPLAGTLITLDATNPLRIQLKV